MSGRRRDLRLVAWNIRQGGGTRLAAIAAALARHEADILVLSEYRGGESGRRLVETLDVLGYRHVSLPAPPAGNSGVLIAARTRFRAYGTISADLAEPHKLIRVDFPGFRLCGVYMPNLKAKIPYWDALLAALGAGSGIATLAIGDFNTCRHYLDEAGKFDTLSHYMDRIEAIGFCDLWRRRYPDGREFSWYSHRNNGFRIDHAFLSPELAMRAGEIRYSHDERLSGLSDHSALVLDLCV
jgi:exonuclease III